MNKSIDYQALYSQLPDNERQTCLNLVQKTRSAVYDAINLALSHEDIGEGLMKLRGNISSLITELMGYIADNDIVGFSDNPGTTLRHEVLGLGKSIDGCMLMLNSGIMDFVDENHQLFLKPYPREAIVSRVQEVLRKKLIKFKSKTSVEAPN